MIRGPQDLPVVRELLALTDLALANGNLPAGDRKALVKQRAIVADFLARAELEERLSLAVARGQSAVGVGGADPREVCLAHLQPEPCRQCRGYIEAGL